MSRIKLLAARTPKVTDDLQSSIQADLKKIIQFFKEHTKGPIGEKEPTNARSRAKYERRWSAVNMLYLQIADGNMDSTSIKVTKLFDKKAAEEGYLLQPEKYAFSFLLNLPDYNRYNGYSELGWDNDTSKMKPYLTKLGDGTKSAALPLLKGSVLDLNLVYVKYDLNYTPNLVYFQVAVKVNLDYFKKFLSPLSRASDYTKADLLKEAYLCALRDKPIPSIYTRKLSRDNPMAPGVYMNAKGVPVYVPDIVEDKTVAEGVKTFDEFAKGKVNGCDNNTFIIADDENKILLYSDSTGRLNSRSVRDFTEPDNKYILSLLNRPLAWLSSRSANGLGSYVYWSVDGSLLNTYQQLLAEYGSSTALHTILDRPNVSKFLDGLIEYGNSRYYGVNLFKWMSYMGILKLLKSLTKKSKSIIKAAEKKAENFSNASADDAPAIPNMRENSVQFPHQAEALAKLNIATDAAIIDIATGGGKAGILIQDCINLLNKGLIRRPLIVMPNALIPQFLSEISFFTGNQVNGFALTTEVESKRGREKMIEEASSMPPNTIFVTTFSWLTKGGAYEDLDMDGNPIVAYDSTGILREGIGIDYVAVDESQNIKNTKSNAHKAVVALGQGIKYKRISTGTLISNNPLDLVGQLHFLDPLLLGSRKDFEAKYAIGGNAANGFKSNAAEEIRARLRAGSSYIMYREKDWAPLLPTKKYSFVRVSQTPEQAKLYKYLTQETLTEINNDPKLRKAWEDMKSAGDDMEYIPVALLGKLAKLEIFLTAPDSSMLMKYADTSIISPKVGAIDELIDKSLAQPGPNNKVIVAVHYKASAMHLLNHSKHKDIGIYYDASKKDLIPAFQDPKSPIKVMFAVVQSIKEGLNFQVANRIIIADVDWTPGNLKQLEARIFRPHIRFKGNDIINLNEGKTVYIDTVIADDSADCVKYAFQSYKKILNSIIMENCPVEPVRRVPLSEEALTASFYDAIIDGANVEDKVNQFNAWNEEEIEFFLKKNGKLKFRKVKETSSNIGTEIVSTPWVKGMTLPFNDDEEPFVSYLESLGYNSDLDFEDEDNSSSSTGEDLTKYNLVGIRVRTEYGEGRIRSIGKNSLGIVLDDGGKVRSKPGMLLHKIGSTPESEKDFLSEKNNIRGKGKAGGLLDKVARERKKAETSNKPSKTPLKKSTDKDTYNPKVIRTYLKEQGIVTKRQKGKATGKNYCSLIQDGRSLRVETEFFKDLPLSTWKEYAKLFLEGNEGVCNPYGDSPYEVKESPETPRTISRGRPSGKGSSGGTAPVKTVTTTTTKGRTPEKGRKRPAAALEQEDTPKKTPKKDAAKSSKREVTLVKEPNPDVVDNSYLDDDEFELDTPTVSKEDKTASDSLADSYLDDGDAVEVTPSKGKGRSSKESKGAGSSAKKTRVKISLDEDDDIPSPSKRKPKVVLNLEDEEGDEEVNLNKYLDDYEDSSESKPRALSKSKRGGTKEKVADTTKSKSVKTTVVAPPSKSKKKPNNNLPKVELNVGLFNGIPSLVCLDEEEGEGLQDIGFNWSGEYWAYKVTSANLAAKMLESLKNQYTISTSSREGLRRSLSEFAKGTYRVSIPEESVNAFFRSITRKARKGTIRIYPLVLNGELWFVVDRATHPGVNLSRYKFKRMDGYYINTASSKASLRAKFARVLKAFNVVNEDEVRSASESSLRISL